MRQLEELDERRGVNAVKLTNLLEEFGLVTHSGEAGRILRN